MQNKTLHLKLSFWHYFLVFVAIALTISAILKVITPKTKTVALQNETIVSNYDKTKSTFKKIFFSGTPPTLPESFNLFRLIPSNSSAELLASQIINRNNLMADANIPNYWISSNTFLTKSNYEKNYTFTEVLDDRDSDVKIIRDEAIRTCTNFYSKYSIDLKLVPQEKALIFLSKGFEQVEVDEKDAYSIQIPLTYELDGYKVFYESDRDYPFFCKIDNKYNLDRVVFKDFFYNFEAVDQMPPISIDQAIASIKSGTVSIISAQSKIADIIDLNWINEADLYSVQIEYRYDDALKIVYPFYRFQARLTNAGGLNIEAELITPAIASATEK